MIKINIKFITLIESDKKIEFWTITFNNKKALLRYYRNTLKEAILYKVRHPNFRHTIGVDINYNNNKLYIPCILGDIAFVKENIIIK